ncbi:MAG: hypothetical protein VB878_10220 [Pirellulaceae bacterium]
MPKYNYWLLPIRSMSMRTTRSPDSERLNDYIAGLLGRTPP